MENGNAPFVVASDSNNGVTMFVNNENSSRDRNVLGVNYNGSVVENFYNPYDALFSYDVKRISFKTIEGNKYHFLFIKSIILQQKSKYEYGFKFNEERMKRQLLLMPTNSNGEPDYTYMEHYMKYLEYQKLSQYLHSKGLNAKNY
ncbi:restriction endonuclease subunit S [Sphingobacterium sp. WM]|uniref:restriction endonuclease subunit S n=1 Tax=Sphingobacterium TaxID=28453 RepID=UPI00146F5800|nr:restriction endonuclease subunit S [Sphingobacterium sp. WM]WFB63536.1 restriction endonuclease subunit S [Sphingobacterium sp. WM]